MSGDFLDTLLKHKHMGSPSSWLLFSSLAGAIAHAMQMAVPTDLVELGVLVSGFLKMFEAYHQAHVTGKKLDVEKQFIATTASASPSILISAKLAGLVVQPPEKAAPAPAPAPTAVPAGA